MLVTVVVAPWSDATMLVRIIVAYGSRRPDMWFAKLINISTLSLILCYLGGSPAAASVEAQVGPGIKVVHALAQSPTAPSVWLAATDNGVWRSDDSARSWRPVAFQHHIVWSVSWAGDGHHASLERFPGIA